MSLKKIPDTLLAKIGGNKMRKDEYFYTVQSDLTKYNGLKVMRKSPMSENRYDKEDVGQMWEVLLEDGTNIDVFDDELYFERIK